MLSKNHFLLALLYAVTLSPATASAQTTSATEARRTVAPTKKAASLSLLHPDTRPVVPVLIRFIVKYRQGSPASRDRTLARQKVNAAVSATGLRNASGKSALMLGHARRLGTGGDVLVSPRPLSRTEAAALLENLRSDPEVLYAQFDHFKHVQDTIPNDPRFADLQWDMFHPTAGIGAPRAWDTTSGQGVIVAVLDTGYRPHRDLVANLVPGYDFISYYGQSDAGGVYPDVAGDGDGRDADATDPGDWLDGTEHFCGGAIADSSWHGTHVAGTVAAVANNGVGIAGAAFGAKVQPIRVMGHCGGYTSDIVDGIIWASGGQIAGTPVNQTPAEVLNLSLTGYYHCSEDPAMQEAIAGAISRGVTVVAAAGNYAMNAEQFSPASCPGVVTVGATGVDGGKSYFSNYGSVVTVSAPGGNARSGGDGDHAWIWSLGNSGLAEPVPGPAGDVLLGQVGTSMSAPHVAAVVAMMQSASVQAGHGALSPALVRSVLRATAKPFMITPPSSAPIGTGVVDAAAAVEAVSRGVTEVDLAIPLMNRAALSSQVIAAEDSLLYRFDVPSGTRSITFRTYGGTGDVALYVQRGAAPTAAQYLAASSRTGNTEAVVLSNPVTGRYYVRVMGMSNAQGVNVLAAY